MRWLRRLWHKSLTERRLDSELQFHLEQQIADYVASGLPPCEARRRASLEFGGLERFKEECRETHWENHVEILARDFRVALRGLARDRRFAFIAIFALALGIGASTAIFSVVDNALLEPFPYKDSRHLVTIRLHDQDQADRWRGAFLFAEIQDIRKQNHVFDGMVANLEDDIVYSAGDGNLQLGGNFVSSGTFEFFGVAPFLGRSLAAADYQPGAPPVFVLRHATWVGKFNSDPSLIGKTFMLNGVSRTLVGIAAPRFAWGGADLWMPRGPDEPKVLREGDFARHWGVVAHLKPGVTAHEASADLNVIAKGLSTVYAKEYPKHFAMEVLSFGSAVLSPRFRNSLYVFLAAVGLLLLIGCGNVANLLLARAAARKKEFAVRAAMGASRFRLVRQLLAESVLLAISGAMLGIFFAWAGVKTLAAVIPDFTIASETVIEMNGAVLLFALVVGVSTVFLFGLVPALQASRDLHDSLRDTGKGVGRTVGRSGLRNAVIVLEVALSLTLLFTAGLFMRSFVALQEVPLGLRIDHVLTARMPLPAARYKTAAQLTSFFRPLLARLKSVPGIPFAAETSTLPPYGGIRSEVEVPGKAHTEKWDTLFQLCSEDYSSVLRIQFLDGRSFTEAEVNDVRKVAVINQTFRRSYFGDENPIGRRIQLKELKEFSDPLNDTWFEVIGVVADVRNQGLQEPLWPEAWIPYTVTGSFMRGILVRTTNEPKSMIKAVGKEIWATDPSVANAPAFYNLGILYFKGCGLRQDYAEALRFFDQGSRGGDAASEVNLGYMYDRGLGVIQDHAIAASWYRKAAERGDPQAQYNLADLYLHAEGVPHDEAAAFAWFQRAALQGHTSARIMLGSMYALGRGTPKDVQSAYLWISAAALQGDTRGNATLLSLEPQLTPAQLAEARLRTRSLDLSSPPSPDVALLH